MRSSSRNHNFLARTSSSSSYSSVSRHHSQTTSSPKPSVQTPIFSSFTSLVCFILSVFILIFFRRPLFAILGWIVYVIAYTLVLGIGFVLYLSREDVKQWVFLNLQILFKIGRRSFQTVSRLCLKDVIFWQDRISPADCKVTGFPEKGYTGDLFRFTIQSYSVKKRPLETGGRHFEVLITLNQSNRLSEERAIVKDHKNGTYTVSFDIGRSGTYSVYTKVYGKVVTGAPLVLEVHPEKYEIITTKQTITVGEYLEFIVKPLRLDSPSLQRKRINPLRETFKAQVTDKKCVLERTKIPNCYQGKVMITTSGDNIIEVFVNESNIPVASTRILALAGEATVETSTMRITSKLMEEGIMVTSKGTPSGSNVVVVSIETRDKWGNFSLARPYSMEYSVFVDMKRPIPFTVDNLVNAYSLSFLASECGIYRIICKLNGVELQGSPLQLYVLSEGENQIYQVFKVSGKAEFKAAIVDGQQTHTATIRLSSKSLLINTYKMLIIPREYQRFLLYRPGFKAQLVDKGTVELSDVRATVRVRSPLYCLLILALSKFDQNVTLTKKIEWFGNQLRTLQKRSYSVSKLKIRREKLLEDSIKAVKSYSIDDFRTKRIEVSFKGELGYDMGGLTKEWFDKVAVQMASEKLKGHCLFHSPGDNNLFQPSPFSDQVSDYQLIFRVLGRIVAKSIYESTLFTAKPMSIHFTPSFYKQLLGIPISLKDIETVDPLLYKNRIQLIQENDIATVKDILADDIKFSETLMETGGEGKRTYNLKYLGSQLQVSDKNKQEYLTLLVDYLLKDSIGPQINEFKKGFRDIIPEDFLCVFDWNELELLICGIPDISIDDIILHTEFTGGTQELRENFFATIRSFTAEHRTRFLQFVTGSSSIPVGGLSSLSPKLTVNFYGSMDSEFLPRSHTCFNSLDMPLYPTLDIMQEKLVLAVTEAFEGFQMG